MRFLILSLALTVLSIYADSVAVERCSSSVVAIYGKTSASVSSGVVLDNNGYIITNQHVIDNEEAITIIAGSSKEFNATVIGYDTDTDIALIKVDSKSLVPATVAKVFPKRGDDIYAVGYPLQTHQSVSKGIVSATHINNLGSYKYQSFIESDVLFARGNSGGALCNSRGELIGINSAIKQEFAFSIEIDKALKIAHILKIKGKFERGSLGISVDASPLCNGALITKVKNNSSFRIGDCILSIDNNPITSTEILANMLGFYKKGEVITFRIIRKSNSSIAIKEMLVKTVTR